MSYTNNQTIKPLPFNSRYAVDTYGAIYRKSPTKGWVKMSPNNNGRNYRQIGIVNDGITKRYLVHRLILETFVGPCPTDYNADHINNNTLDNRLENLRWVHKSFNYTRPRKSRAKGETVSDELRTEIMIMLIEGYTTPQIEMKTGVKRSNCFNIKYSKKYKEFKRVIEETLPMYINGHLYNADDIMGIFGFKSPESKRYIQDALNDKVRDSTK